MAFTPVQKLSITSGMAMALLGSAGVVAYLSTSQLMDAQAAAAITNANIARLDRVLVRSADAEGAARRYVETMGAGSLALLDSAQNDVEYALDSIRVVSEDHPVQRRYLDTLGPIVGARFRDLRQAAIARRLATRDSATKLLAALPKAPGPERLLADMRAEEVRVLGERSRLMANSARTSRVFIVGGSLFAFLLALVALQPLRGSVERRITQRLTQVPADPDDSQ
ncbi:MAG TPA: CHASE3 domain-containing protein [Gemmatimonadaceae bacterium]|nr:CHASE3 domain-containing protein [Gemmatimonadaceae bacterium]